MLTFLAPLFLAQAAPPNADWNCDEPTRQQEMNWCAGLEYEQADRALNRQWKQTAAAMKARDAEWEDDNFRKDERPGFFASLLEAQRAWLRLRDAHCRLEGYDARGGSMEPLLVATCKTALTEARTEQLRALARDNP
ncbi:lysozyme inhibitor LprI family protein [Erythrobacter sp.]|uniref:lysozyme inhibitor LprI family protein n=1 Tax=Erythrobacter sp. TaxID=1042 RepID=UPI001425E62F|nr:lysozyme inhibitor LprI family protein [Erythrobacter sp.]QIQ86289.1 MAG: DUF1311 domain-containing protein [Erythrobacter sp.]